MISDSPVTLLRATALHVALLFSGAAIPAVHLWRARCITLVEELRQAMQDAESPKTDLDEVSLAQCVLLDELTLRLLPSESRGEWLREPLQVRFHGVQDGAKRVWERIDSSLRNGRQDLAALDLYGIVLDLGFDGGRDDTDAYRLRVRSMLDHGAQAGTLSAYGQRRKGLENEAIQLEAARELPVILVAGPYAAAAFARDRRSCQKGAVLRRSGDATWLLVETPDELAAAMTTVQESRQRLPDAVLIPVISDGNLDEAAMRREFLQWRHSLDESSRFRACVLPCYVAICARLRVHSGEDTGPLWFGNLIDLSNTQPQIDNVRQNVLAIRRQLDQAWFAIGQRGGVASAALGHAVFDWLEDAALLSILASLANTAPFSLRGLLLADVSSTPARTGAWARWLTGKTGLEPPSMGLKTQPQSQPQPLPLPDVIPRQAVRVSTRERRKPVSIVPHALAAVAAVMAMSIGASTWRSSRTVAHVAGDLDGYLTIPAAQMDARRARLETLRSQYDQLERYAKTGVPTALGWGLHRGDGPQIEPKKAISTWSMRSPVVTIDDLSLFDSGKTTLKPGAEAKLRTVLDLIRANPDKRILIAGHTDNVGSSAANLRLSEARARAIRDWFVDTASLSVTRFAIQGYGDTRPVAGNESPQGRAMNRRVEIILVPDSETH